MEKAIVDSGVILIKFWLEVSEDEQTRRLQDRVNDPRKIWKLSPMDLKSYSRWYDYSRARDDMFAASDSPHAPWYVVPSDDKRRARLNVIHHVLKQVPYKAMRGEKIKFPKRQKRGGYREPSYPWKYVKAVSDSYPSQPPSNPARFRPVRTYSLRFMTVQMSSLR